MVDYTKIQLNDGGWIPTIAFGTGTTYSNRPDEATEGIVNALRVGYKSIDTAVVYNTESSVGKALAKIKEVNNFKREDVFITTKIPPSFNSLQEVRFNYFKFLLQIKCLL